MRSVMNHRFSEAPNVSVPRSMFNRSHGFKTTFDAGYLVPVFLDMDVLPGDTIKLNMTGFARLSTPIYPVMDNMFMETFFFAVPYRLLWSNWQKFCGEQVDPGDSIDYTIPVITNMSNADNQTIWDYMGLPTKVGSAYEFSALPFRAYNLIWNEWFRDENLQDSVAKNQGNGPDGQADYTLLRRGKRHDYFTSCLPWTQKSEDVIMAIGDYAPIFAQNVDWDGVDDADNRIQVRDAQGAAANLMMLETDSTRLHGGTGASGTGELFADLTEAQGGTVNELRQAFQVQRLLEKDARSGTRYIEILKSHFGVTSPDARVQRPEYLGGGRTPVNFSAVAKTNDNAGQLSAIGTAAFGGHGFVKSFTEHCVVIGLINVRADLTYQEGLDRGWSRQTRYDFYWPTLAHLGEQAVLNKEIYIDATTIADGSMDDVFGYQERWAEYRYKPSRITGKFRSNDAASLDAWHLGIEFGAQPTLDDTFIQDNPPIDRVIATPTEPHFIFDSYFNYIHTRPLPTYSTPGFIDHF